MVIHWKAHSHRQRLKLRTRLHPSRSLFPHTTAPENTKRVSPPASALTTSYSIEYQVFHHQQVANLLVILMTTQQIRQVIITALIQLNHNALMPSYCNATHLTIVGVL